MYTNAVELLAALMVNDEVVDVPKYMADALAAVLSDMVIVGTDPRVRVPSLM
jgi:hypothetical protein